MGDPLKVIQSVIDTERSSDVRVNDMLPGFHSGAYEECRLLGYINPVRPSQETHYLSATELSQLMLCTI
jgi:hypothetical protein